MELVIIVSTITSFFSHFLIDKAVIANAISVVAATLITWVLVGMHNGGSDGDLLRTVSVTVMLALAVSLLVGLVFSYHKKCSE